MSFYIALILILIWIWFLVYFFNLPKVLRNLIVINLLKKDINKMSRIEKYFISDQFFRLILYFVTIGILVGIILDRYN